MSFLSHPDFPLTRRDLNTYERNKFSFKIVTFMWYSNDMFLYVFKAEFVMLVSLKVPSGKLVGEIVLFFSVGFFCCAASKGRPCFEFTTSQTTTSDDGGAIRTAENGEVGTFFFFLLPPPPLLSSGPFGRRRRRKARFCLSEISLGSTIKKSKKNVLSQKKIL